MPIAITDDKVRVAYDVRGRGPAIVFVHGLGDDRRGFLSVVERLEARFTCVTLDLRGHGETRGAQDFDAFGLDRDLDAVVRALGLVAPIVVGHSLGAFVATTYATRCELTAVVNVDQPLMLAPFALALSELGDAVGLLPVADLLLMQLESLGLGPLSKESRQGLWATRAQLARPVVLGAWGPLLDPKREHELSRFEEEMRRIRAPYLSLFGRESDAAYQAWIVERIPHAVTESWPGCGHFLHMVEPGRFVARLASFLASG